MPTLLRETRVTDRTRTALTATARAGAILRPRPERRRTLANPAGRVAPACRAGYHYRLPEIAPRPPCGRGRTRPRNARLRPRPRIPGASTPPATRSDALNRESPNRPNAT